MKTLLPFGFLLLGFVTLCGCGGTDSVNSGRSDSLDTRAYLLENGTKFSVVEESINEAAEVVSSGTASYSVRFLLENPLADNEEIEISANLGAEMPGSQPADLTKEMPLGFTKLFVLKKADLTTGENGNFGAVLNLTQVATPLVPSPLLTTQIRAAAERGEWYFRHTMGSDPMASGYMKAAGYLLPARDTPLAVTVPSGSPGLPEGDYPFGSLKLRATGITVNARIPISGASAVGQVTSSELVVRASADPSSAEVLRAPLAFVQSESQLVVSAELAATADDLSPDIDTRIKYLTVGIQRGFGFLSLTIQGRAQPIQLPIRLKVGQDV